MSHEMKTRLLVVDDEQSIRRLCMTIGTSLGFVCAEAESAEAVPPPGRERVVKGLDALRAKSKFFFDNNEVHKSEVLGPYPHQDRFAVRFVFEVTFKPTGQRRTMDEVGLFTVVDGKIAKEEFFYPAG